MLPVKSTEENISLEKGNKMRTNESTESIIQNLKDAGCDMETIGKFMSDLQNGQEAAGLRRLALHRKKLLISLHKEQKCIDCLDYLIYQIKKANK